jgi:hypothetical protein
MAQVAFAMQLPALSEEQEKRLFRYGYENCDETCLVKRDGCTLFGGILITPFKSKRVAQSSFTGYLKSWGITTRSYSHWYRQLSLKEYFAEFEGAPRVVGQGLQDLVSATVMRWVCAGMSVVIDRDREVAAKAKEVSDRNKEICDRKARVQWRTDSWTYRVLRGVFNAFNKTKLDRIREQNAMFDADRRSKKVAIFGVEEAARQVIYDHESRLKTDWEYREKIELEQIALQRELSARGVAVFNALHPEKAHKKRRLT